MSRHRCLWFVFAAILVVASSESSHAQRPAHYYPARPSFSTYLLYRQFNSTGIPNFYTYVQPERQYRDFLQRSQEKTGIGRQPLSIGQEVSRALDAQLRQRATTGIGRPSASARFDDTIHFYPTSVGGPGR